MHKCSQSHATNNPNSVTAFSQDMPHNSQLYHTLLLFYFFLIFNCNVHSADKRIRLKCHTLLIRSYIAIDRAPIEAVSIFLGVAGIFLQTTSKHATLQRRSNSMSSQYTSLPACCCMLAYTNLYGQETQRISRLNI